MSREEKGLGLFHARDVAEVHGEYLKSIANAKKALGTLLRMLKEEGFPNLEFIKDIEGFLNSAEDSRLEEHIGDLMEEVA